jgi:predicted exporter
VLGDQAALRDALPDGLRQQFMSPRGRFAVMIHPRDNVWEVEPMGRYIADMRAVDPNVTGVPITQYESMADMRNAFALMSLLAVLVIAAIVTIDFKNERDILLALLPLGVGTLWTAEIMGLLGISFNLANFFSVPILIGLSVNGSVYVLWGDARKNVTEPVNPLSPVSGQTHSQQDVMFQKVKAQ